MGIGSWELGLLVQDRHRYGDGDGLGSYEARFIGSKVHRLIGYKDGKDKSEIINARS